MVRIDCSFGDNLHLNQTDRCQKKFGKNALQLSIVSRGHFHYAEDDILLELHETDESQDDGVAETKN